MAVLRRYRSGSTHAGLGEWLLQRLSALYLSGFVLFVVLRFSIRPIHDYQAWQAWFAGGAVRIAFALFFVSLLVHAWVGMRSVYLDYLKPFWLRLIVTVATGAGLSAIAVWLAGMLVPGR